MASISIVDLFVALENHVGKEALLGAFAAYSGSPSTPQKASTVPPVPGAPVKVRKPQSEETKAAAATIAAKAIVAAAPEAVVAVPVPAAAPAAPAATEEKPKKVLSEEQKAKMAAGRAAAAAKKAAAAAAAPSAAVAEPVAVAAADAVPVAVPAPEADGNASDTSSQKRRGPKKLNEMSPEERAAHDKKVAERKAAKATSVVAAAPAAAAVPLPASPAPAPAAADENGPTVFAPFTHKGVSYLRNMRGDLLTEEYEWVGRYNSATKIIDTKFAKPADLEDE